MLYLNLFQFKLFHIDSSHMALQISESNCKIIEATMKITKTVNGLIQFVYKTTELLQFL